MNSDDSAYLLKAIEYYKANRPYFYVFLRPYELYLFHKKRASFREPILDFGCGDGFFTNFLFGRKGVDYGVDKDPAIVPAAQTIYKHVILLDDTTIDLPSQSVGTIISNSVFEHLDKPAATLQELHRILKHDGKVYTTVIVKHWETCLWGTKILGDIYKRYMQKIQRHHSLLTSEEWLSLFTDNGFRIRKMEGYLHAATVSLIDIYHYLSLPSLIAKKLFQTWNPPFVQSVNTLLFKIHNPEINDFSETSDNPCYFFELGKIDCIS